MGTKTLGSTNGPANNNAYVYYSYSGGDIIKAASSASTSDEMYVDAIWVYCGSYSGSQYFQFLLYNAANGGGSLLGNTGNAGPYGVGYGWNSGSFAQGSYLHVPANQVVSAAAYAPNNIQTAGLADGGSFYYAHGVGVPNPFSGTQQTGLGNLAWYITYFPSALISSIPSTPVAPGDQFVVGGRSFSAGVTSVQVNGVACPSWTVNSDTQLTATVPSGATSGPVTVNTYAGNWTTSGSLIIASVHLVRSGVETQAQGLFLFRSGSAKQTNGVLRWKNGAWVQGQ